MAETMLVAVSKDTVTRASAELYGFIGDQGFDTPIFITNELRLHTQTDVDQSTTTLYANILVSGLHKKSVDVDLTRAEAHITLGTWVFDGIKRDQHVKKKIEEARRWLEVRQRAIVWLSWNSSVTYPVVFDLRLVSAIPLRDPKWATLAKPGLLPRLNEMCTILEAKLGGSGVHKHVKRTTMGCKGTTFHLSIYKDFMVSHTTDCPSAPSLLPQSESSDSRDNVEFSISTESIHPLV